MSTDKALDQQIAETEAEIAASERQKSAPKRLAELLGLKRRQEQEQETAEQQRQRIEAERLELVHSTGSAVDAAIDALVAAVANANAAQTSFWAVSKRTETRHGAGALAMRILEAALRGTPEGVRQARFSDYLPAPIGRLPKYMEQAYAQSDSIKATDTTRTPRPQNETAAVWREKADRALRRALKADDGSV
jgi:hypothetical protein